MNKKRAVTVGLLAAMSVSSLSGCGLRDDFSDIPLVPELSRAEVIDYYKASLEYDTIATRTVKPNEVTYEMTDVSSQMEKTLAEQVSKIEELLKKNSVTYKEMNPNIHRYMKYVLDDKVLTRKEATKVKAKEALGHYFVDVEYTLSPKSTGSFKGDIQYFGINGGFKEDIDGNVSIDTHFMSQANSDVSKFKADNPDYKGNQYGAEKFGIRKPSRDVTLFNTAAGMNLTQTAMMPSLSTIYSIPEAGDKISGYGIYPQGQFTLKTFGYDRSKMKGTATIRYVFKQELMDPTKIEFTNCYVTKLNLENTPEIDADAIIPEFVEVEAAKLLERSDRAISNNDISAMMNGKIYEDVGPAVLNASMREYSNKQRHMSKIKDIVGRDKEGKMFMVEFETTSQEGAIDSGTMGTYISTGYMVMQQVGTEFHITDYVITDYKMQKEPQIDTDSTILKRLASLNLTGEVTKDAKKGIGELMSKLYTASTERKLDGMYECFNTDINLLSSTRREYLNSQLRSLLVQHGTKVPAKYIGTIEQWIGGADNQVEFITNEIVDYYTIGEGVYMRNYYLVSRYDTAWVIDEMKIIESKDVSGEEYASIRDKISKGVSVMVTNVDNNVKDEADANAQQAEQQANGEQQGEQPVNNEQQAEQPVNDQPEVENNTDVQEPNADNSNEGTGDVVPNNGGTTSDDGWS